MAGGKSNNKQSGNLDRTCQWMYHHRLRSSVVPKPPFSEKFKAHQKIEKVRIILKSVNDLQESILRVLTDSIHCDLSIVHGYNVIRTNQCIVRARSPRFYEVLKPYFEYDNKSINCIIGSLKIYECVADFVRLLYSNSDVSHEEEALIKIILNTNYTPASVNETRVNEACNVNERLCTTCPTENCNVDGGLGKVDRYGAVDVSPASSDMADSGLETGSVSPHENTASENSSADFEESQTADYASVTDDVERVRVRRAHRRVGRTDLDNEQYDTSTNCGGAWRTRDLTEPTLVEYASNGHSAVCSSSETEQQHLDSSGSSAELPRKTKLLPDEVYQYEARVLSDPFYETDSASDENESFEIIDTARVPSVDAKAEKEPPKCRSPPETRDVRFDVDARADSTRSDSSGSTGPHERTNFKSSNYYFIDASTLNDEVEILTSEVPKLDRRSAERSQSYSADPTDRESAKTTRVTDDQSCKFTTVKSTNFCTSHERVAEFERELKVTEHLEPLTEPRKIKRVDSISDDKADAKATDKESLAVEIKETDSGESAQPSPCPDNNTNVDKSGAKAAEASDNGVSSRSVPSATKTSSAEKESSVEKSRDTDDNAKEDRRPSLIRRNTFELDSDDERLSVLRQEYERRQGTLVFRSSIPQYSGHRVDGDSFFDPSNEPSVVSIDGRNSLASDVQLPASVPYRTASYLPLDKPTFEVDRKQAENSYLLRAGIGKSERVYPVAKSASDKVFVSSNETEDVHSGASSNSLPISLNRAMEKESRADATKWIKCDEATPIVSGGASTSDYSKPTDSPTVRRKTESTPIVSGGSVIMHEPEARFRQPRMSSSLTAWVVDMSDCNKNELRPGHSQGMSQSFSASEGAKRPPRKISAHEKHGSLGFFVNLKDMDSPKVSREQDQSAKSSTQSTQRKKPHNENDSQYCEFYVDISQKNGSLKPSGKPEGETGGEKIEKPDESADKKNIFSMFIDLSEPAKTAQNDGRVSHEQIIPLYPDRSTKLDAKVDNAESSKTDSDPREDQYTDASVPARERAKPSVFMFIESDSPVVRRRTLSSSRPAFKRHSWNVDKTQNANVNGHVAKELMFRKEHKRAHSLSVDRGDLTKLQAKQSPSSHSLSDAARAESLNHRTVRPGQEREANPGNNMDTSSEEVFEFDTRDTPPNSHVEIVNEELRVSVKRHDYKELVASETAAMLGGNESKLYDDEFSETSAWEKTCTESTEGQTRKSETFDISSGSGPSPGSDNHDYELTDLLNGDAPNRTDRAQIAQSVGNKISETQKSLNETIKKIECELKSPEYGKPTYERPSTSRRDEAGCCRDTREPDVEKASSNFVRLSDLDKTPVCELSRVSDVVTVKEERAAYRMSNSIPETSWIESKLVVSRTNGPVRTLSRKITSVMSTSLPSKQKSPLEDLTGDGDAEGIISESDLSSMQSSMGRSGAEGSTEETETSSLAGGKPYNRLGEDLLRMFLEEINPDVTIDVAGRQIRAHKCILSSRCQYFAAILSGGWIESTGNVISLQGYSYNAVHFALCHIYSGESNIPDSISIVELATLADMLCLEGLKEVIGYTLKVKYCHLFHKPCQICAVGVLECMPLAAAYGLDEVYRKSLRWITRHFVRIWPCKAFATLPRELMEKCYHQHIVHMSTDNVLQTMMDCDKLLATLPNVRWAEPVFRMVSNLLETSVKFLSDNFSGVLGNENFQSLGRELTWNISRLEDNFTAAAERLPPEQACKSYSKLHKMLASAQIDDPQAKGRWGPLFIEFLKKMQSRVEKCLVRDAARAARTTSWLKMDLELRRRIQELACLVILPHETSKRLSRQSNFLKDPRATPNRSTPNRSLDLKRVKMVISEHNDKTLKQVAVAQPAKKVLNKPKSDPLERKIQEDKRVLGDATIRPKSWPNKIEVKSRYLEPRNKSVPKENAQQLYQEKVIVQQRRKIMISSSDSSRTSSPAMKRATDKKALAKVKLPVKKDAKALSSDSLTESTAGRASGRKDLVSKSCGITRPESPLFKQKAPDVGLSVDSLAETKKNPVPANKRKLGKMDTSMSTDSLMTEITTTPKSNASNKLSPTLSKGVARTQMHDRAKKSSPPMQQKSPLTVARRPPRSLENSTAASRSRAAAISAYHGSPSLRRNLLDAAKAPDVPTKSSNNAVYRSSSGNKVAQSSTVLSNAKKERRDGNSQGSESPGKKSSPKLAGANRPNKPAVAARKPTGKPPEDKIKGKCHNADASKQPTVGSRSGTFLKDEPTILKRADIKSSQVNT